MLKQTLIFLFALGILESQAFAANISVKVDGVTYQCASDGNFEPPANCEVTAICTCHDINSGLFKAVKNVINCRGEVIFSAVINPAPLRSHECTSELAKNPACRGH